MGLRHREGHDRRALWLNQPICLPCRISGDQRDGADVQRTQRLTTNQHPNQPAPPKGDTMLQTQISQVARENLTATILEAKAKRNLSFEDLTKGTDLSIAFVTAAFLGQHPLSAKAAGAEGKQLELAVEGIQLCKPFPCVAAFQTEYLPIPRSIGSMKWSRSMGR